MRTSGVIAEAKVWAYGDYIDTDVLAPGLYMKSSMEVMASHCLETVDPDFVPNVNKGDVICAGKNFGMGSSREQAAQSLVFHGVVAVLAPSFGGIFYRNAINHGLMVLVCADAPRIATGHHVSVDATVGSVYVKETGMQYSCEPMPEHLITMLADGGLVPHLERRFRT
ncbi:MAG: 3-isopropylmalate dehydratase [Pseudomonadota bacterium]|nr:3-isopropylmalate dehydratase [Pseudomonadota bacterium]